MCIITISLGFMVVFEPQFDGVTNQLITFITRGPTPYLQYYYILLPSGKRTSYGKTHRLEHVNQRTEWALFNIYLKTPDCISSYIRTVGYLAHLVGG